MWPWSKEVEDLYKEQIEKNSYVRSDSDAAVKYARKIYNQNAILQIISMQTKEGKFLTQGIQLQDTSEYKDGKGDFGYTSELIKPNTNEYVKEIKCNIDGYMEETQFGKGTKKLDYQTLEEVIPGFKFMEGRCNPCVALKDPPQYTCPFTLDLKNEEPSTTSNIWKYLWNR